MAIRSLPLYPTEKDFFEALRRRDPRAHQYLYTDLFPSFEHWVLANNGSVMDAEDSFQKGLMSFLLGVETGTYQLQADSRITTVAFEYCKRVWLTELKSARLRYRGVMPEHLEPADTSNIIQDLERGDTIRAVQLALGQLKDECRKLLEWFYAEDMSLREIAQRLGMKEESVKSKRYQCAEKWKGFYQKTKKQ